MIRLSRIGLETTKLHVKTDIGINRKSSLKHVAIAGPSTLQGQLLARHFLAQPDKYLVSAISASRADERFMKYSRLSKKFFAKKRLEQLSSAGIGFSGMRKVDALINAGAGLPLFLPLNLRWILTHPIEFWRNFEFRATKPFPKFHEFYIVDRISESHINNVQECRRLIHSTDKEKQPELFIQMSSHQYYQDNHHDECFKEIHDNWHDQTGVGHPRHSCWVNYHFGRIEKYSDIGHDLYDTGHIRHDIRESNKEEQLEEEIKNSGSLETSDYDPMMDEFYKNSDLFEKSENQTRLVVIRPGWILTKISEPLGLFSYLNSTRQQQFHHNKGNFNWIHYEDFNKITQFCIENKDVEGTLNAVSPVKLNTMEFNSLFRRVMYGDKQFLKSKQFRSSEGLDPHKMMKFYGFQRAQMFWTGARCLPTRAINYGFGFTHTHIGQALQSLSGRKKGGLKEKVTDQPLYPEGIVRPRFLP